VVRGTGSSAIIFAVAIFVNANIAVTVLWPGQFPIDRAWRDLLVFNRG
jgi:hypothetical protein